MHQDAGEDEEDDDDDDVDFNLGGRDHYNPPVAVSSHDAEVSTPQSGAVHRTSAKDDG